MYTLFILVPRCPWDSDSACARDLKFHECSHSLCKMMECSHVTYVQPLMWFKSSLDYLKSWIYRECYTIDYLYYIFRVRQEKISAHVQYRCHCFPIFLLEICTNPQFRTCREEITTPHILQYSIFLPDKQTLKTGSLEYVKQISLESLNAG